MQPSTHAWQKEKVSNEIATTKRNHSAIQRQTAESTERQTMRQSDCQLEPLAKRRISMFVFMRRHLPFRRIVPSSIFFLDVCICMCVIYVAMNFLLFLCIHCGAVTEEKFTVLNWFRFTYVICICVIFVVNINVYNVSYCCRYMFQLVLCVFNEYSLLFFTVFPAHCIFAHRCMLLLLLFSSCIVATFQLFCICVLRYLYVWPCSPLSMV